MITQQTPDFVAIRVRRAIMLLKEYEHTSSTLGERYVAESRFKSRFIDAWRDLVEVRDNKPADFDLQLACEEIAAQEGYDFNGSNLFAIVESASKVCWRIGCEWGIS